MHPEEQLEVHPLLVEHNRVEEDSNPEEVEEDTAEAQEYPLEKLQGLGIRITGRMSSMR